MWRSSFPSSSRWVFFSRVSCVAASVAHVVRTHVSGSFHVSTPSFASTCFAIVHVFVMRRFPTLSSTPNTRPNRRRRAFSPCVRLPLPSCAFRHRHACERRRQTRTIQDSWRRMARDDARDRVHTPTGQPHPFPEQTHPSRTTGGLEFVGGRAREQMHPRADAPRCGRARLRRGWEKKHTTYKHTCMHVHASACVSAKRHPSTLRERRAMADPRQRKGTSLGCKEGRRKFMWFPRCNKVPSCSKVDPSMTTQARVRRSLPHRSRLASCHSIPIRTPFLPASSGNR